MIKKLSIVAGISFAIFGIVAAVMAQQAEKRRQLSPVEKLTEKLGDFSNSIKKSFTPTVKPRAVSSERGGRHNTQLNSNKRTKKKSSGILGAMRPRVVPGAGTRYQKNNGTANQDRRSVTEAPRFTPNTPTKAPQYTANSPATVSSSRRNPERFLKPVPVAKPETSANIVTDRSQANSPATIRNPSNPAPNAEVAGTVKKESTTVQPGGYKSLRDRLRNARRITQGETQLVNNEPNKVTEPKASPLAVENRNLNTKPTGNGLDSKPIRIESEPRVANAVDLTTKPKSEDPGWNRVEQNSVLKKTKPETIVVKAQPKDTPTIVKTEPKKELPKVSTPKKNNSNVLINSDGPVITVKTVGPKSINVGKVANYQVKIANLGRSSANDVVVHVKIPGWTSITGVSPSVGTAQQDQDSYKWSIDQLASGRSEILTIKLVPTKSKPFSLGIKWGFAPRATDTVVQVLEPKLKLELTGASELHYGKTGGYQLTVSNPGTGEAENVTLSVETPGNGSKPHRRTIGKLAAGESKTMKLKLTATQAGTLLISANVKADAGLADEAAKKILVRRAGLKIAMSGPKNKYAGTAATYKIRVANPGNATAENIRLAVKLPVGAKYLNSTAGMLNKKTNQVSFKIDSLEAGADRLFQVRCTLSTAGDNTISVQSVAEANLTASTLLATNVEAIADLKLEVSDPLGPIAVGDEVTYQIRIKNRGSRQAESVQAYGFFSRDIEAVRASGAKYRLGDNGKVIFSPISTIAANGEVVLKIVAKAKRAGTHKFQAKITCSNPQTSLAAEETTRFYTEDNNEPNKLSRTPRSKRIDSYPTTYPEAKKQRTESVNVITTGRQTTAEPKPYRGRPNFYQAPNTKNPVTEKPARFNPPPIDLTPLNTLPR